MNNSILIIALVFVASGCIQTEEKAEHKAMYWEFISQGGKQAVRKGKWKLVKLDVLNSDKAREEYRAIQGDPEKAAGLIDSKVLGDAGEYDTVSQARMTNAGMINRKRMDYNDVGWEILDGNYFRFLKQIDPEGTSYGWWHKGPMESVYSRFARSTDSKKGNTFYFDVNDECNIDGKIAIRLVWLDEGNAQWQLKYNGTDSPEKIAFANSNGNTGEWKEEIILINDAKFGNSGAMSADIEITNLSEKEALVFHLIEIEKI